MVGYLDRIRSVVLIAESTYPNLMMPLMDGDLRLKHLLDNTADMQYQVV